jgi:dienelactone hydrolase
MRLLDEVSGKLIEYSDGENTFEGYFALPRGARGKLPCVLLAHDWSGLNDGVKLNARRIAQLGYASFAIDVYGKGIRGSETDDNSHLMNPLLADRSMLKRRLLLGYQAGRALPEVDPEKMAIVGYCFGGLCALDLARANPSELRAAISFHGLLTAPVPALGAHTNIGASILLLHGWEDPVAPPADVLAIAKELTQAQADWQLHAFGHAQHAFTFKGANMPERGVVYNELADNRSWNSMRQHLASFLGDGVSHSRSVP